MGVLSKKEIQEEIKKATEGLKSANSDEKKEALKVLIHELVASEEKHRTIRIKIGEEEFCAGYSFPESGLQVRMR